MKKLFMVGISIKEDNVIIKLVEEELEILKETSGCIEWVFDGIKKKTFKRDLDRVIKISKVNGVRVISREKKNCFSALKDFFEEKRILLERDLENNNRIQNLIEKEIKKYRGK